MNRFGTIMAGWLLVFATVSHSADAGPLKALWKNARGLIGKAIGETTESGGKAVARTMARHTDEAALIVTRSADEGSELARHFGDEAAELASQMSPQETQRLVMLADELKSSGRANEVLRLLKSRGRADEVLNFLGRHKGTLATGAAISVLIANPEAVLDTAKDVTVGLANATGQYVAQPIIETAGGPAVWGFLMLVSTGLFLVTVVGGIAGYLWWKGRRSALLVAFHSCLSAWTQRRRSQRNGPVTADSDAAASDSSA